jgi:hypothetical protein
VGIQIGAASNGRKPAIQTAKIAGLNLHAGNPAGEFCIAVTLFPLDFIFPVSRAAAWNQNYLPAKFGREKQLDMKLIS